MTDRDSTASSVPRTLEFAGRATVVTASANATLLHCVRAVAGAAIVPQGCTDGSCGSCRVVLDGELLRACQVPWSSVVDGARLDLAESVAMHPAVERAIAVFDGERPTRCKQCVPALSVTASLVARGRLSVDQALVGFRCACTGHGSLRRALESALASPGAKPPAPP